MPPNVMAIPDILATFRDSASEIRAREGAKEKAPRLYLGAELTGEELLKASLVLSEGLCAESHAELCDLHHGRKVRQEP